MPSAGALCSLGLFFFKNFSIFFCLLNMPHDFVRELMCDIDLHNEPF